MFLYCQPISSDERNTSTIPDLLHFFFWVLVVIVSHSFLPCIKRTSSLCLFHELDGDLFEFYWKSHNNFTKLFSITATGEFYHFHIGEIPMKICQAHQISFSLIYLCLAEVVTPGHQTSSSAKAQTLSSGAVFSLATIPPVASTSSLIWVTSFVSIKTRTLFTSSASS